jgi:hypothetical protein
MRRTPRPAPHTAFPTRVTLSYVKPVMSVTGRRGGARNNAPKFRSFLLLTVSPNDYPASRPGFF